MTVDSARALPAARTPPWRSPCLVLAAITILALGLRLYRIGGQSVFWDEYSVLSLVFGDFDTMRAAFAVLGPGHVPAYYAAVLVAKALVGLNPDVLRLVSVGISLTGIPLIYLVCRRFVDRRGAYWAALLLAISPIHIWWGQAIQCYVTTTPLALLSTLLLLTAMERRRAWLWVAYTATSGILVGTHYFTGLLLVAHGLYLLYACPGEPRLWVKWGLGQMLAVVPTVMWLLAYAPFMVDFGDYTYPTAGEIAAFFVGHDVVRHTYEFGLWGTWPFLPEAAAAALFQLEPVANTLLMVLAASLISVALWARGRFPGGRNGMILLALCAVIPPLGVMALTYAWKPVVAYRFIVYSSFAFYGLVGAGMAAISGTKLRAIVAALLLALYAYQWSLIVPTHTRTPWREAIQVVRAEHSAGTATLHVKGLMPMYGADMVQYEARGADIAAENAYSLHRLHEIIAGHVSEDSGNGPLWMMVESELEPVPAADDRGPLDGFLAGYGIPFKVWPFKGMSRLDLYAIGRPAPGAPSLRLQVDDGLRATLGQLDLDATSEELLRDLARVTDYPLPRGHVAVHFLYPYMAFDSGADALADALVAHGLRHSPGYPPNHLNATLVAMRHGRTTEARAHLETLEHYGSFNMRGLITMLRLTLEQSELARRDALLERYTQWGILHRVLADSIRRHDAAAHADRIS